MIGGDDEVVERIRPVLESFSSLVVRMGPLGAGLQAKLARNLVQYASWLAAYEAQVLAEAAGIELAKLAQVIKASDARIGGASTLMFRRTVAPFTAEDDAGLVEAMRTAAGLAHKDLRAAMEMADALGVDPAAGGHDRRPGRRPLRARTGPDGPDRISRGSRDGERRLRRGADAHRRALGARVERSHLPDHQPGHRRSHRGVCRRHAGRSRRRHRRRPAGLRRDVVVHRRGLPGALPAPTPARP